MHVLQLLYSRIFAHQQHVDVIRANICQNRTTVARRCRLKYIVAGGCRWLLRRMKHIAGMSGCGKHFRVGTVVIRGGDGFALEEGVGYSIARITGSKVIVDSLVVLWRR